MRAVRVRRARYTVGRCQLCRQAIIAGQRVGRYRNVLGWIHLACAAKRCETCRERLTFAAIAAGHSQHPTCQPEPQNTTPRATITHSEGQP